MKILPCPLNGRRPDPDVSHWGEGRPKPNPNLASDDEWADYVFNRNGAPGVKKEWWCHTPSNTWFIAERDTEKDVVLKTYFYQGEE